MEWGNDAVIEFIELLQTEPSIWNPKNRHHKNRNLVNDAWIRIKNSFSVPFTVEELKKKRNILLTQYRDNLKKIKDSTKTGSGAVEIFKPTWFAFDAMHNYMGSVYNYHPKLCTKVSK
ncbi:unnamed protein product [Colias eurytheme]|nr:unnamed protein product [Colias eurytheme]